MDGRVDRKPKDIAMLSFIRSISSECIKLVLQGQMNTDRACHLYIAGFCVVTKYVNFVTLRLQS